MDRSYPGILPNASSPDNVHVPDQKQRQSKSLDPPLTRQQQREHRRIERVCIFVEQTIGGLTVF